MAASSQLITASESYLSSVVPSVSPSDPALHLFSMSTITKLKNVGPSRVRELRSLGVGMQVVSHIPISVDAKTATKLNDQLYAAICLTPDRYAAMALLPSGDDVKEAARELQRCVTKYRFVGGVLGLAREGGGAIRIDGQEFEELWTTAEKYRIPISLKMMYPTGQQVNEYEGNFPDTLLSPLVTHFYASHTSSPLPILHLFLSGAFDRHPNLRLILPSSGFGIPPLLPMITSIFSSGALTVDTLNPQRSFLEAWQQNFFITMEDILDLASLRALLEQIPMDRIMYAQGYPFGSHTWGRSRELLRELRDSGIVSKEEWERIAWGNAEWLFGLRGVKTTGLNTERGGAHGGGRAQQVSSG